MFHFSTKTANYHRLIFVESFVSFFADVFVQFRHVLTIIIRPKQIQTKCVGTREVDMRSAYSCCGRQRQSGSEVSS